MRVKVMAERYLHCIYVFKESKVRFFAVMTRDSDSRRGHANS